MERKAIDLELARQSSPVELECIVSGFDSLARILTRRKLTGVPNEPGEVNENK